MKKIICLMLSIVCVGMLFTGCTIEDSTTNKLKENTTEATNAAGNIIENQPAPTDLDYSLERYNLIRRAYWVNGQREKANSLVCAIEKPLGYIVLFSDSGAVVGNFVVDGKVSSLSSYLFPAYIDSTSDGLTASTIYIGTASRTEGSVFTTEIPGIDGSYGSNVSGIFFFTIDGKYIEWNGDFLYSDIPFEVDNPVLHMEG